MNVNELKNSQFLTKEDCVPDILVTIKSCEEKDVSTESEPTKMRWVLFFEELEKPLVLNVTNGQIIAAITGSDESDDWIGEQIVLWNDMTVMYKGEIKGGIRVRPQQGQGKPPAKSPVNTKSEYRGEEPPPPTDDDIPF
jgi:hypothetical protein